MTPARAISRKGFTLVETLIALGIFSFVITGVLSFSNWMIRSVHTEASKAERNVENLEMLKLFTQPIYFGALGKFPHNSQLQKCMNVDLIECDSTKEYPVTAYDLATKQVLNSASLAKDPSIRSQITFQVHCPNKTKTCDKADYYTVIVKTYFYYQGIEMSNIEKKGIVTPAFDNVATYVPDATMAPGRPINIIIYLDTSNSLAFAKDQIKNALDSLLSKIANMDATLGVYAFAPNYTSIDSDYYYIDGGGNKVPLASNIGLPVGFIYYKTSSFYASYFDSYTNQAPATITSDYRIFNFLATDTSSIRAAKLSALKNVIDALFLEHNGHADIPLCNILRMLEMPGSPSPFKLDTLTPTTLLVLSNENDETSSGYSFSSPCAFEESIKFEVIPDYAIYNYHGDLQSHLITADVNTIKDGAPYLATITFPYDIPYDPAKTEGADCSAFATALPPAQLEAGLLKWIKNIYYGWTYAPGAGITPKSCKVSNTQRIMLSTNNTAPQYICQRIVDGTYTVPPSFVPNSCRETVYKNDPSDPSPIDATRVNPKYLVPSTTTVVDALYNSMKTRLNLDNFYYTAIVHPDTTTCTMTPGSQVGTRYVELASKPGIKSNVVPVCAPDYSAQIDKIAQWAQSLAANDLELTPLVAANMSGVEIIRSGASIKLIANTDYYLTGTVLVFRTGLIQPNDQIKVYLK